MPGKLHKQRLGALRAPVAILFDWDNTLVDSIPSIGRAINITLTAMGQEPWPQKEMSQRIGRSLREVFPDIFGAKWQEAREIFYAAFERSHLEELKALPGAIEVLKNANSLGLVLGVVSNKVQKYLEREVEHLRWNQYFFRVVGAGHANRDKPAPEPVFSVLEGSGVDAGQDVWFVGDNLLDMECGTAAGCQTVLINKKSPNSKRFGRFMPNLHLQDLNEFGHLLKSLRS